jgi:hypothetical protein
MIREMSSEETKNVKKNTEQKVIIHLVTIHHDGSVRKVIGY